MGVDLNIDLGELPDEPVALYSLATVANVACGGHAGNADSMRRALGAARLGGARVAAHPSYPDREGFGRRHHFSDAARTALAVESQCTRLHEIAADEGIHVQMLKLHGALYHDAAADAELASSVLDAAARALPELDTVVGPPDSVIHEIARARGLSFQREAFADRRYDQMMRLVPRTRTDALLTDAQACVSQAVMLAKMGRFDTLCMHSDTPGALKLVREVRRALSHEGLLAAAS